MSDDYFDYGIITPKGQYLLYPSPILSPNSISSSQNNDLDNFKDDKMPEKDNLYSDLNQNLIKNDFSNEALIHQKDNNNFAIDKNVLDKQNLINPNTLIGETSPNTNFLENLTKTIGTQNVGPNIITQEQITSNHETAKEKGQCNDYENSNDNKGLLTKKRKKKLEDKGPRKNHMLNVYKSNFIKVAQKKFIEMLENTKFYSDYKIHFNKIDKRIYINENSSNNLLFLDKKLKDVLSWENEQNENIIKKLEGNNDCPICSVLKIFLDKTILDLMYYYSNKCNLKDIKEEFGQHLRNEFDNLIKKLTIKGKSDEYVKTFTDIINNIKNVYLDMKNNNVGKKKQKKKFGY